MAYKVVSGDTLSKIAAASGMTVAEIVALNPDITNPNSISVGQSINVTAADSSSGSTPSSSGDPTTPSATTDSHTGDEDIRFVGLAGRPEVWKDSDTGEAYVVYYTPGVEPPIPMLWKVRGDEDLKSFFGDDPVTYDKTGTMEQFNAAGALQFGEVDEFVLQGENPFSGWVSQFEREVKVLPFLEDPEVAALFASSWLEGRNPTDAELAGSEWFQSKTQGEQQWWQLKYSQPKTAAQMETSNRIATRELMRQAGISNPPAEVSDYLSDQWTQGLWTEQQRNEQIALLADPTKTGERDGGLLEIIGSGSIDTTQDKVKFVDDELQRWLGPKYGNWSQANKDAWVAKLRNDPDAADSFQSELSRQRVAMYGEYENPDLTYEDIATPWRNYAFNEWGQNVNESDPMFDSIIKANDASVAQETLRTEGLRQGIGQVEDKMMNDLERSFGGGSGVRGMA